MKVYHCPDCKVTDNTCSGCQRYCEALSSNLNESSVKRSLEDYINQPVKAFQYECCKKCPCSPQNGGSGVCNCTLPYFEEQRKLNTMLKNFGTGISTKDYNYSGVTTTTSTTNY